MRMLNFVLDSFKGETFVFKVKRQVLVASTVCTFIKIFNNENFSFSFENLRIFEDIWRICNLRRSLKNFWINKDSSYLSSVHFQKPKNLRIRLQSIFNLCCNTALLINSFSDSLIHWLEKVRTNFIVYLERAHLAFLTT